MNRPDLDDPEDIEAHWRDLVFRWKQTDEQRLNSLNLPEADRRQLLRDWWGLTSKILFLLTRASTIDGVVLHPMPVSLLSELARIAANLSIGKSSLLLDTPIARGSVTYTMRERQAISIALHYLTAVRDGRIQDPSSNKTVRRAFGVSDETVRGWEQKADEICDGMPGADYSAERIVAELKRAGKIFKTIGRSHQAIRHRNKKKSDT